MDMEVGPGAALASLEFWIPVGDHPVKRRTKDGRLIDVRLTLFAVHDATGRVAGASGRARDIADRLAAERELQRLAAAAEYGTDVVISACRCRGWSPALGSCTASTGKRGGCSRPGRPRRSRRP